MAAHCTRDCAGERRNGPRAMRTAPNEEKSRCCRNPGWACVAMTLIRGISMPDMMRKESASCCDDRRRVMTPQVAHIWKTSEHDSVIPRTAGQNIESRFSKKIKMDTVPRHLSSMILWKNIARTRMAKLVVDNPIDKEFAIVFAWALIITLFLSVSEVTD